MVFPPSINAETGWAHKPPLLSKMGTGAQRAALRKLVDLFGEDH